MKMTTLKSVAIAVGLASSAFGQATSPVVGYETISLQSGFNLMGVRLHEKPVATGSFEAVTATTAQDTDVADFAVLLAGGGTYILEIEDGSGIIQEVVSSSASGDTLTVADLTGVVDGASYSIRAASTLASVFGVIPTELDQGFFGPTGADTVSLFNGTSFDSYYYDSGSVAWQDVSDPFGAAVDPAAIDLVYTDSFIVNANTAKSLVVSGDLKAGSSEAGLTAGFNYVGSVGPVGQTLSSVFGAVPTSLDQGFFGPTGSDQILIFNGTSFDSYYYDSGSNAWQLASDPFGTGIDPATIELPAGYIVNANSGKDVNQSVPSFYVGL